MIDKLIEGNIKNDPACLENVENLLKTLYEGWKDVVENPRPDGVPSPKLQPEEFKKYQTEAAARGDTPDTNDKVKEQQTRSNLKLMA